MNDIEALSNYENSIAMENADIHLKKAARFVTKSNDNDGIPYALDKILNVI